MQTGIGIQHKLEAKKNKEANREVDIIYAETHNLVLPVSTNKQNKQRSKRGETKDRNLTVHAILH